MSSVSPACIFPVKLKEEPETEDVPTAEVMEPGVAEPGLMEPDVDEAEVDVSNHKWNICGEEFSSVLDENDHKLPTLNGEKLLICPTFNNNGFFSTHSAQDGNKILQHTEERLKEAIHVCDMCSKVFIQQNELDQHRLLYHCDKKPHICTLCDEFFTTQSALDEHKLHHGHVDQKPNICHVCYEIFDSAELLSEHSAIHDDDDDEDATDDDTADTSREDFSGVVIPFLESLHETINLAKEAYKLLPNSSQHKFGLILEHLKAANNVAKSTSLANDAAKPAAAAPSSSSSAAVPPVPLPLPPIAARKKPTRKRSDTAAPTRMSPNQCPCGLNFSSEDELITHINTSHDEYEWRCSEPDCGKMFRNKSAVWKHYRQSHLGYFHHYCGYGDCSYGNDEETTVKYHRETRHGIPSDVRCPKCNKTFPQKNKLRCHMSLCGHNLKLFDCKYKESGECHKSFRSQTQLHHHYKTDHAPAGKPPLRFPCQLCPKKFRSHCGLRNHMLKHA